MAQGRVWKQTSHMEKDIGIMSNQNQLEALEAQVAKLMEDNAALKAKQPKAPGITLKVSEKGCVAVYGLGRFPVVLYRGQMERLLGHSEQIKGFIAENASSLKVKGEK
jgi:hypothetical protein